MQLWKKNLAILCTILIVGCDQSKSDKPSVQTNPPPNTPPSAPTASQNPGTPTSGGTRQTANTQAPLPQMAAQVPPSLPVEPVPDTELSRLFVNYLDATPANLDSIEKGAGQVVDEVFNEDDLIRAKIWEMQNLIKDRYQNNKYSPSDAQKVRILEAGLAQAAEDRDKYQVGKDATIILGSALALAVLRGYSVDQALMDRSAEALNATGNGLSRVGSGLRKLFSLKTYREAGQGVENWFARNFHKLTPEERLARNLSALGLPEADVTLIQRRIS